MIIKNLKEKIDAARENLELLEAKLFKSEEQNLVNIFFKIKKMKLFLPLNYLFLIFFIYFILNLE
jgi:hypothetical protein